MSGRGRRRRYFREPEPWPWWCKALLYAWVAAIVCYFVVLAVALFTGGVQ